MLSIPALEEQQCQPARYPKAPGTNPPTKEYTWGGPMAPAGYVAEDCLIWHHWEGHLWFCVGLMTQDRGTLVFLSSTHKYLWYFSFHRTEILGVLVGSSFWSGCLFLFCFYIFLLSHSFSETLSVFC